MKAYKLVCVFLIVSPMFFLFAGCMPNRKSDNSGLKSDEARNQAMSKRFQDADTGDQTAVDSAIKLAQDHAVLSEKMSAVQQKNQELIEENAKLMERLAVLEPEFKQAQKELDDANKLLVEMRIETNNWKTDVLGFRDEMRQADKAQLETLIKILEVLGGEIKSSSLNPSDVNSKSQSNISGESNE